jgi:hypothetical protein
VATELICSLCGKTLDRKKGGKAKIGCLCDGCNAELSEELGPVGFAARRSAVPRKLLVRYQGFDAFRKLA